MTNHDHIKDSIESAAKAAVENGKDIQNEVRDIVLDALAEHHLDRENVDRVVKSVLEGATSGIGENNKSFNKALENTIDGLREGMLKAVEASRLAIEEAQGRVDEFSERDIKRAIDDMKGLEALFRQSVADFSKEGYSTARDTMADLATHAERTSAAIGKSVSDALETLQGQMKSAERPGLNDLTKVTIAGAANIASIASGILAGIADSLNAKNPDSEANGDEADKKT